MSRTARSRPTLGRADRPGTRSGKKQLSVDRRATIAKRNAFVRSGVASIPQAVFDLIANHTTEDELVLPPELQEAADQAIASAVAVLKQRQIDELRQSQACESTVFDVDKRDRRLAWEDD